MLIENNILFMRTIFYKTSETINRYVKYYKKYRQKKKKQLEPLSKVALNRKYVAF